MAKATGKHLSFNQVTLKPDHHKAISDIAKRMVQEAARKKDVADQLKEDVKALAEELMVKPGDLTSVIKDAVKVYENESALDEQEAKIDAAKEVAEHLKL